MTSEAERIAALSGEVACSIRANLYRSVGGMPSYPNGIVDTLVAFAIAQAEERGREAERTAIIAWLETGAAPGASNGHDAAIEALRDHWLADAIEAGEHATLIPGEPA